MKTCKYSLLAIAMVVGSEVIFKCLKRVYKLLYPECCDSGEQVSLHVKSQRIINRVIFFPDQGILSKLASCNTGCSKQEPALTKEDQNNDSQDIYEKPHHERFMFRSVSNEKTVLRSRYLKKSSSLVHIVDALDSARCSLKVCVYVITLQDLVDALLRAKNRGVCVKVIVEGQMPNDAALTTLKKHNIAVRVSRRSYLMHHKFALVDAPDSNHQVAVSGIATLTKMHEKSWLGRASAYVASKSFLTQTTLNAESTEPLLLTGSFNWTWTAVVNNLENLIISSDMNLIYYYNQEFDYLWENLEVEYVA